LIYNIIKFYFLNDIKLCAFYVINIIIDNIYYIIDNANYILS